MGEKAGMDNKFSDTSRYSDIMHLSHHNSEKHPRMSMSDRAAQFSPFAALRSFGSAVSEAARLTEERHDTNEDWKEMLNSRLCVIQEHISEHPEITVIYFIPDERKSGGAYISFTGRVKKLDTIKNMIVFSDKTEIHFDDISDISGQLFSGLEEYDC